MSAERYLIGEVSKLTGLSKDTIHFYVNKGLLTPDYIDENNGYRYYSRWNLWQLDIITICRKLSVPLDLIKRILDSHDNAKITKLLMEYRSKALRLSSYYQQVADDILWYDEENRRIQSKDKPREIHLKEFEAETVVAGVLKHGQVWYHANLLEAAKEELQQTQTIRRKYGYMIDMAKMREGKFIRQREYLKIGEHDYRHVAPENLYILPKGKYAVFILHITDESADFGPLFQWLKEYRYETDIVFAEEIGLQLFDYPEYDCEIKAYLVEKNQ